MNTSTRTPTVLRTIEIRYDANGKLSICSHHGWQLNEVDNLVQCQTFIRGEWHIKVAVYDKPLEHLETFGIWLCRALVGDDGYTWRHIDLTDCDR